jgi:hypothetical protein
MSHSDPCEEKAFVYNDGFLEIFSSYLEFFAVKVVSAYSEPADGMCGVILD